MLAVLVRQPPLGPAGPKEPGEGAPENVVEKASKRGAALLCAACGSRVTSLDQRIEVDGAHSHAFLNPAGYVYRIGCFATAPGVRIGSPPSDEFSWFSGHVWEVVLCGACTTHLGWRFSREASFFFALILARLREDPATP